MNLRYSILAIVLGILLHTESQAQQRKYVNEFMNIGVGARGLGMSGSQVASTTDVTAAFWNPAGIAYQNTDMQLGLMHSEYFSSIAKYDYIGATFPLKNRKGVIGFSAIRFAVDDIPYTINLVQPDGTVDYSKVRSISSADYGGLISYARPVVVGRWKDREDISLMWGTNFKIIHRSVGPMANAWGVGLDFGLQGRFGRWKLGAVVRDVTTTYTVWSFSLTEQEKQVFAQTGNEIVSRSSEINTPRLGREASEWVIRRQTRTEKGAARMAKIVEQVHERGGLLLITARFIPGGRTALTLSCGVTRQPRRWFVGWSAIAAVIWGNYAALLGFIGGKSFEEDHTTAFIIAFVTAFSITALIEFVRWLLKRARYRETA